MRFVRRRGQPSPLVMAMARRQVVDRMAGYIRIERRQGDPTMAAGTLDLTYPNVVVYEGRAGLSLEMGNPVDDSDELVFKVTGTVTVPYSLIIGGVEEIIQPIAEDVITVLGHVDTTFVGAVLRITGVGRAGQMTLARTLDIDGMAPAKNWADMTAHPVVEADPNAGP